MILSGEFGEKGHTFILEKLKDQELIKQIYNSGTDWASVVAPEYIKCVDDQDTLKEIIENGLPGADDADIRLQEFESKTSCGGKHNWERTGREYLLYNRDFMPPEVEDYELRCSRCGAFKWGNSDNIWFESRLNPREKRENKVIRITHAPMSRFSAN